MSNVDYLQWLHNASRALGYDQLYPYYCRSAKRYEYTLNLASTYVDYNKSLLVAELGVGMLLPMLCVNTGCQATGYGLAKDDIWRRLEVFGIPMIEWDLCHELIDQGIHHDIVFLCEVIEHLCCFPIELLQRIKRLVKPGGYLVLTTVNFVRISNRLRMLCGRSPLINPFQHTQDGRYHIREFTLGELAGYAREAGYEVLETRHWAIHHRRSLDLLLRPLETLMPSLRNYLALVAQRPQDKMI